MVVVAFMAEVAASIAAGLFMAEVSFRVEAWVVAGCGAAPLQARACACRWDAPTPVSTIVSTGDARQTHRASITARSGRAAVLLNGARDGLVSKAHTHGTLEQPLRTRIAPLLMVSGTPLRPPAENLTRAAPPEHPPMPALTLLQNCLTVLPWHLGRRLLLRLVLAREPLRLLHQAVRAVLLRPGAPFPICRPPGSMVACALQACLLQLSHTKARRARFEGRAMPRLRVLT